MSDGNIDLSKDARALAYSTPLDQINPAQPALFQANEMWWNFERLRKESQRADKAEERINGVLKALGRA